MTQLQGASSTLKELYGKPKHVGACNVFIIFNVLIILTMKHYTVLTLNVISALLGIE
jgi:uncharacterized membrane protein YkvI